MEATCAEVVAKTDALSAAYIRRMEQEGIPRQVAQDAIEDKLAEFSGRPPDEPSGLLTPTHLLPDIVERARVLSPGAADLPDADVPLLRTIAALGKGPKGIALAARASVLQTAGLAPPAVVLFEPDGPAAHWTGRAGFTDGTGILGTPAEKDLGYPYVATRWAPHHEEVIAASQAFSWPTFLMQRGRYANWVDQGRPAPAHTLWSEYLRWAADLVDRRPGGGTIPHAISAVDIRDDRWVVTAGGTEAEFGGLMVTGPGPPLGLRDGPADDDRVLDGRSFWLRDPGTVDGRICVVGAGETAAAVTSTLLTRLGADADITIVASRPVLFSRGETFDENRVYSSPVRKGFDWREQDEAFRHEFVARTDRGVFSLASKRVIDGAENLDVKPGRAVRACSRGNAADLVLADGRVWSFDWIVLAHGFDPVAFLDLFTPGAVAALHTALSVPRAASRSELAAAMARSVSADLAVRRLRPKLHVPMLSAMAQGPGFPNLSSLGLLSDRILSPYLGNRC